MKGRKFLLCYRPDPSSAGINKELWEFIRLEGHEEFFFPEEKSRELFVSNKVILDNGGYFSFVISSVQPSRDGYYFVSAVQIVDHFNVSAADIFDYLCDHWFTQEQLSSWLKGGADLPTKEHV